MAVLSLKRKEKKCHADSTNDHGVILQLWDDDGPKKFKIVLSVPGPYGHRREVLVKDDIDGKDDAFEDFEAEEKRFLNPSTH